MICVYAILKSSIHIESYVSMVSPPQNPPMCTFWRRFFVHILGSWLWGCILSHYERVPTIYVQRLVNLSCQMEEREILNKPRRGAGSCEVLCRLGCTHLVFKDQATTKKHLIPFQSRHEISQFPSIVSLRSYSPGICSRNLADSRIFSLGNFHRFAHLIQILLRRARAYELLGQPEESLGDLRAVWVAQICFLRGWTTDQRKA